MSNPVVKQLIYGSIFVFVLGLIGYGIFSVVRPVGTCFDGRQNQEETGVDCGGSCVSCEVKDLKLPVALLPSLFVISEDIVSVAFEIQNPNLTYGAHSFFYDVTLYESSGAVLKIISKESFLYSGEIKTIVEAGISVTGIPVRAEVAFRDVAWASSEVFSAPNLQTRDIVIIKDESKENTFSVSGLVINANGFSLPQATVNIIVDNQFGTPAGVSKTAVQSLEPFEERFFKASVPGIIAASVDNDQVSLFVEARQ